MPVCPPELRDNPFTQASGLAPSKRWTNRNISDTEFDIGIGEADVRFPLTLGSLYHMTEERIFLLYISMNYREFSVKSKLIISLFQTVK